MKTLTRIIHAAGSAYGAARDAFKAPKSGRVVTPHRSDMQDFFRSDLTITKLKSVYENVLNGEAREISSLYDRMLYRDAHIRAEANKRFAAVRRLAWEILPATPLEDGDKDFNPELAARVASYCRRTLRRGISGFEQALDHVVLARGRGVMVFEVEHLKGVPVAAHCVPFNCLRYDDMEPWRLRIASGTDWKGVAVDEFPAGQFIVHAPEHLGGNAFAGGLFFASLLWYCFKVWDQKFLMTALEIFGQPMRIGKYRTGATAQEIAAMKTMLTEMGATAAGVFEQGAVVEMVAAGIASSPAAWPQERVFDLFNKEITKLWIGGTLTTAMDSAGGSQAAATIHKSGLDELRDEDINSLNFTITDQLLRPLVAREFGDDGLAHLATFRRIVEAQKDLNGMAELGDKAVNRLGAKVPKRWVTQELGIPQVEGENLDEPLPGAATFDPFASPVANKVGCCQYHRQPQADFSKTCIELRMQANRALEAIRNRKSPVAKLVPFILSAVLASQAHSEQIIAAIGEAIDQHESRLVDEAGIGAVLGDVFQAMVGSGIEDMAELARQAILFAELSGMSATQSKMAVAQLNLSREQRQALSIGNAWLVVNADTISFEKLPFVEAIEALRDRIGIEPKAFEKLDAEARSRAFRVAAVWDMDLLFVAHTALVQTIARGETARDFKLRALPAMAERNGWTGENPWHADVVFYQNFAMAHMAGAYRQMADLEVPAWQFAATGESCPICTPMIGKTFKLSDRRFHPPLHFYCDCDADPVFEQELQDGQVLDSKDVQHQALSEYRANPKAFIYDPAHYAAQEPIDLSKYPATIRPAFAALAKEKNWEIAA